MPTVFHRAYRLFCEQVHVHETYIFHLLFFCSYFFKRTTDKQFERNFGHGKVIVARLFAGILRRHVEVHQREIDWTTMSRAKIMRIPGIFHWIQRKLKAAV